jgi:hypothetical protein
VLKLHGGSLAVTIRSEWSNGQVLAPVEADRWAFDAGDAVCWMELAAGTDDVVRLAVET